MFYEVCQECREFVIFCRRGGLSEKLFCEAEGGNKLLGPEAALQCSKVDPAGSQYCKSIWCHMIVYRYTWTFVDIQRKENSGKGRNDVGQMDVSRNDERKSDQVSISRL